MRQGKARAVPSRNPEWTEDEMILGLAVYRRIGIGSLSKTRREVLELSELLNLLPIHPPQYRATSFRNPQGVTRRLNIFRELESGRFRKGYAKYKRLLEKFGADTGAIQNAASEVLAKYGHIGA